MKKILILWSVLISVIIGNAQKNDYQWLFGYGNQNYNPNNPSDSLFGGSTINFNNDTPVSTKHIRMADFDIGNVSYCDKDGSLLFYSNCGDVFDRRDSIMMGGDSLNYGWYWIDDQGQSLSYRYSGLRIIQGILALPSPSDTNMAYLLHYIVRPCDFLSGISAYLTDTSFYSLIDTKGNNGYGRVVKKDQPINSDTLTYGFLSAVKHGNGRDWWVIHPYYFGNCYYEFLLSDTGVGLASVQCLGDSMLGYGDIGTSCFSPDGNKYFWVNAADGIHMFDFDRCTGVLSDPQKIPFPIPGFGDSIGLIAGIAVSPNNRYLYVIGNVIALQYDLQATNIGASVDTIAQWDGSYDITPHIPNLFFLAQSAPDGKIYINSNSGSQYLHVINQPDKPGDSCQFMQHGFNLHAYNESSLPNFPNYRLGPLRGSSCDTLSTMAEELRAEKEKILKIFPNPGNDIVTIDYGFTDWNKGSIDMEITDVLGEVVYALGLPMYSGYQKLDISRLAPGLYQVVLKRNSAIVAVAKLVKE